MNTRAQAQFDLLKRTAVFGTNHLAELNPLATQILLGLTAPDTGLLDRISHAATAQDTGTGTYHGGTVTKAHLRQQLRGELRKINRTATAIAEADDRPAMMPHFRMPRPCSDVTLAAKANAIADAAQPLAQEFLAYAHPDTFIEDLRVLIATFATAESTQNRGGQGRSGATAQLPALLREGMLKVRQLDAFVHNRYENDPQTLGEWKTATHLKRARSKKEPAPEIAPAPVAVPPAVLPELLMDPLANVAMSAHNGAATHCAADALLEEFTDKPFARGPDPSAAGEIMTPSQRRL